MPSRDLKDLHPMIVDKCHAFLHECDKANIDVIITCTYRSNEEQAELYAQGRTKPGKIVTKAKPGQSKHNFTMHDKPAAKAFDIAIKGVDNKLIWDVKHPHWGLAVSIGRKLGLNPGADFTFKDYPHFEIA